MKKIILAFAVLFSGVSMYAQSKISGTVVDDTGAPVISANVVVNGGSSVTTTDIEGNFTLEGISTGDVLEVSYIGLATKMVTVSDPSQPLNIKLSQDAQSLAAVDLVSLGSRNRKRTSINTPVPVDVINAKEIVKNSPQITVTQILNYVAPSFSSNTQTISDGTDHIDPASLRGLGPDQVLVLMNGKRRHNTALVNVNGTSGRGSVGTDLNSIPTAAVERIEVLRDGAAAQYGSDAIAGVINVVLRKGTGKLDIGVNTGANISKGSDSFNGGIDGERIQLNANYGLNFDDDKGFVNITASMDIRDYTNRMEDFKGQIFSAFNALDRGDKSAFQQYVGTLKGSEKDNEYNAVQARVNAIDADKKNLTEDEKKDQKTLASYNSQIAAVYDKYYTEKKTGIAAATQGERWALINAAKKNVTDAELAARNLTSKDFLMRVGQSAVENGQLFYNAGYKLNDQTNLYTFGGVSYRAGDGAGFYRLPFQARSGTLASEKSPYVNGFLPEIHSTIQDQSMAIGIKGVNSGWNYDLSNTTGKNRFAYTIKNTLNASLEERTKTEYNAGGYEFNQNTTNLDITRSFENIGIEALGVSFGAEYKIDNYIIFAGEEGSYTNYGDTNLGFDAKIAPDGSARPGSSQVFPGFKPANESDVFRTSVATYLDLEADITKELLLSAALRYENYSDFGNTLNWKATARFKVTEDIAIRAGASTGFRAPSLHQQYFNSVSTVFVDGLPNEVGTFRNNSRVAQLLGIPRLKEETSLNFSGGITAKLPGGLKLTIDAYRINIDDRIVYTGRFSGKSDGNAGQQEVARLLAAAGAGQAAFFANAIDTKTQGVDVVLSHSAKVWGGELSTSAAFSYVATEQEGDIKASKPLRDAGLTTTYFSETSRILMTEATPRNKGVLTFNFKKDKFNANLNNSYFGEVTHATNNLENQKVMSGKVITDLTFSYQLNPMVGLSIGSNNLFDIYPDEAPEADQSSGRFVYSRRTSQFGFNGRYVFARLDISI